MYPDTWIDETELAAPVVVVVVVVAMVVVVVEHVLDLLQLHRCHHHPRKRVPRHCKRKTAFGLNSPLILHRHHHSRASYYPTRSPREWRDEPPHPTTYLFFWSAMMVDDCLCTSRRTTGPVSQRKF